MKLAIMQPYFFPYIGYFQLISAVDKFIVYDNIKYTKKGWINRNRMLRDGRDATFSLPLKAAPDSLDVYERSLSADFDRNKLLNQIQGAYRRAPFFSNAFPVIEQAIGFPDNNLFFYIFNSIREICGYLGIRADFAVSSEIAINHDLKAQEKVLALCEKAGAEVYVNAIGGMELYSRDAFAARGIELKFIKSKCVEYSQFGADFVPWLSIVDVIMFNSVEEIQRNMLGAYELIQS
ncbi:WbqC family protein [Rhizobium sp. 9T]|uniref:WbqC family protein n=1 Tax=Rhizobium croatiense TaxID=2867516 RepID=UPI001C93645B|nr:WbqC family protein [Rhizobium croatiense]MBY4607538.1 WbqC family protein [Rhizobium croatiense]